MVPDLNVSETNAKLLLAGNSPILYLHSFTLFPKKAGDGIWTHDIHVGNVTLYHWATPAFFGSRRLWLVTRFTVDNYRSCWLSCKRFFAKILECRGAVLTVNCGLGRKINLNHEPPATCRKPIIDLFKTNETTKFKEITVQPKNTPKQAFDELRPGFEGATLCFINNAKLNKKSQKSCKLKLESFSEFKKPLYKKRLGCCCLQMWYNIS